MFQELGWAPYIPLVSPPNCAFTPNPIKNISIQTSTGRSSFLIFLEGEEMDGCVIVCQVK